MDILNKTVLKSVENLLANILRRRTCVRFFLCILVMFNAHVFAAKLETVAIRQQAGDMVAMCSISGRFSHKIFVLHHPERVVVDFTDTQATPYVQKLNLSQGVIAHFRSGSPNPHTLRLVFDMKQPVSVSSAPWKPAGRNQNGLRINIHPISGAQSSWSKSVAANAPRLWTQAKPTVNQLVSFDRTKTQMGAPVRVKHEPPRSMRDVIVVIDPGHGGKDPGAMGIKHSAEKHVVLAIALKLKQLIDRQPGMHAVLTRNGDYYVGLRQRLNIARKYNADIFVAIHADAFANHQSHGASVFALSQRGATSEAARWLAEKENNSELGGVNLSDLDDRSGVIRTVLLDLSQTATISSSLQMGSRVLKRLDTMTDLHNNHVEQARFVVLKSPDIPSVLIETGFISNLREEANLTSSAYQSQLARAIFDGIKGYFWDYPPHGTRVEAMSGINRRLARATVDPRSPW